MIYPKGVLLALSALLSVRSNPHDVPVVAARNKTHLERARGIGWGFKDLNDMYALSSLGWWYNWCADGCLHACTRLNHLHSFRGIKATKEQLDLSKDLDMEFVPMQWAQWGIDHLVDQIPPNSTVRNERLNASTNSHHPGTLGVQRTQPCRAGQHAPRKSRPPVATPRESSRALGAATRIPCCSTVWPALHGWNTVAV